MDGEAVARIGGGEGVENGLGLRRVEAALRRVEGQAQRAPAGIGAICNSMAVLFTALIAFLFYGEKIGLRRAAALFAGFAGVVVLAFVVEGLGAGQGTEQESGEGGKLHRFQGLDEWESSSGTISG